RAVENQRRAAEALRQSAGSADATTTTDATTPHERVDWPANRGEVDRLADAYRKLSAKADTNDDVKKEAASLRAKIQAILQAEADSQLSEVRRMRAQLDKLEQQVGERRKNVDQRVQDLLGADGYKLKIEPPTSETPLERQ